MDEMIFLQPFPLLLGGFAFFIAIFPPTRFSSFAVVAFATFIAILIVLFKVPMKSAILRLGFYLQLTSAGKVFFRCSCIYVFASLSTRESIIMIFLIMAFIYGTQLCKINHSIIFVLPLKRV